MGRIKHNGTTGFGPDGELLHPLADKLAGIHLYGLARPSLQPAAARLSALPVGDLQDFARLVEKETGIRVIVSP